MFLFSMAKKPLFTQGVATVFRNPKREKVGKSAHPRVPLVTFGHVFYGN
jgi:hypothetical protein